MFTPRFSSKASSPLSKGLLSAGFAFLILFLLQPAESLAQKAKGKKPKTSTQVSKPASKATKPAPFAEQYKQLEKWVNALDADDVTVQKALDMLNYDLKGDTSNGLYWYYKARIEDNRSVAGLAEDFYLKAKERLPRNGDIRYYYAQFLWKSKDDVYLAAQEINKALAIHDSGKYYDLKARLYHDIDQYEESTKCYKKALDRGEQNEDIYKALIGSYIGKDSLDQAMNLIEEALAKFPTFAEAYNYRSLIHLERSNFKASCSDESTYLSMIRGKTSYLYDNGPTNCQLYMEKNDTIARIIYMLGDMGKATTIRRLLKDAIVSYPDSFRYALMLGNSYAESYNDSASYYFQLALAHPKANKAAIHSDMADAYFYLSSDSTIKYASLAIKAGKATERDYRLRALKCFLKRDYKTAIKDLEALNKLAPSESIGYSFLAQIYYNKKNYKKALANINKAIERNDQEPRYYEIRAYISDKVNKDAVCDDVKTIFDLNEYYSVDYILLEKCGIIREM